MSVISVQGLTALWENAGLDGGPPCIGTFFTCRCKGCWSLRVQVEMDGQVPFNKNYLDRINMRYIKVRAAAFLDKWKERFEEALDEFLSGVKKLGTNLGNLDYDAEVEEILRSFIQRERSMDATMKDLWNFLESREEIDEDQLMNQQEREGLKKALQTFWVTFIP